MNRVFRTISTSVVGSMEDARSTGWASPPGMLEDTMLGLVREGRTLELKRLNLELLLMLEGLT